ncbi:hypothetical protein QW180_31545 [Vibrio sinaloensis]|nr:hypothetical protein [Vibrio sinaloensis]
MSDDSLSADIEKKYIKQIDKEGIFIHEELSDNEEITKDNEEPDLHISEKKRE